MVLGVNGANVPKPVVPEQRVEHAQILNQQMEDPHVVNGVTIKNVLALFKTPETARCMAQPLSEVKPG